MKLSVLSWLEKTSVLYSDKIMFKDERNQLTFSEFNKITLSIGSFLSENVKPENPVVVMSGRNVYTPAAYIGVARAGCFYAPMDATMPKSRLNQILSVVNASVMLVDEENFELARSLDFNGKIFLLNELYDYEPNENRLDNISRYITGETPLYVIFTSGSTGVPKGVITSHQSLMCYIDSFCKVLNISDGDVLGNQSPLDYIAAIRDIYIPMKMGASTFIIPKNEFSMPTKLFETLNLNHVTTLCWSVAGVELPAKLGAFSTVKLNNVDKICFSGSVMSCKHLKTWQENLPDATFVNQYGPTEATASCTYYVVEEKVDESTVLPIGVPYENYKIILLTEDNQQTPEGEIGEICVSGPILALGYYGSREKTDESFIQNPLNNKYRELIYKTGDLGKLRPDGILEFHGRKDRQIKHMGHRIELGEIETTAKQIENISECCALYHKEKETLYLFYCGDATSKEIVLHFRNTLPAFMVPRKTIQLDSIPKLPNGKTDMQSLKEFLK